MAQWLCSPSLNNGYIYNLDFIGIISNIWTEGKHNVGPWKVSSEINDGYVFYYTMEIWLGKDDSGEEGEGFVLETGGHSNPYKEVHSANRSHITGSHNDHKTTTQSKGSTLAALATNAYVCSTAGITALKSELSQFATKHSTDALIISQVYGANIWNAVILSKLYPFDLSSLASSSQNGIITMNTKLCESSKFGILDKSTAVLNFGQLDMNVTQGYEISQYQFNIYLPYAGLYNLDIKGNELIDLIGYVDIFNGLITYIVYINDQISFIANGEIGADIPFNLQQAQMQTNRFAKTIEIGTKLIPGKIADIAGELYGKDLQTPISNFQISGALQGFDLYQNACIIVKQRQMVNDSYGYENAKGVKRLKFYDTLGNGLDYTYGYVKCVNYQCPVDKATEAEKEEICRLMNEGVIL